MKTRILFVCGREPQYPRNEITLRALKENFEVIEVTDNIRGSLTLRTLRLLPKLLLGVKKRPDFIFVGFYGHLLLPLVNLLARKPIIFDAFVSTYDTLCFDRKWFKPNSVGGRLAYWLDRYNCLLADKVLLDTKTHADYFVKTFDLPREKFSVLYLGYDDSTFYPRKVPPSEDPQQFIVFYYGSFLPLQGIEYIIRAARLLEHETVKFEIAGRGPTYREIRRLANDLATTNVDFVGWIPYHRLPIAIARASICLGGHFSAIGKAQRVIAGKTYQFLAMAKPTIVGDNPANRELFTHRKNVYMCRMADEEDLATAIMTLKDDQRLREQIAAGGFRLVTNTLNTQKICQSLISIIEEVFSQDSPAEPHSPTTQP
jgi:glycosyltransferase involved in cell wall biosynthesis